MDIIDKGVCNLILASNDDKESVTELGVHSFHVSILFRELIHLVLLPSCSVFPDDALDLLSIYILFRSSCHSGTHELHLDQKILMD